MNNLNLFLEDLGKRLRYLNENINPPDPIGVRSKLGPEIIVERSHPMFYDVVVFKPARKEIGQPEEIVLDTRVSGNSPEQAAMRAGFEWMSIQLAAKTLPVGDAAAEVEAAQMLAAWAELRGELDCLVQPFRSSK